MAIKLIKRIREVRDYLVVGTANSSHPDYWSWDFKEYHRVIIGDIVVQELEPLKQMDEVQLALFDWDGDR